MKFFHGCTSADEAKKIYHKLAKCFHPDKGGDADLMKDLTRQYETWDAPVIDPNPFHQMYTPYGFGRGHSFSRPFATTLDDPREIKAELDIWKRRHADVCLEREYMSRKLDSMITDRNFHMKKVETLEKKIEELKYQSDYWCKMNETYKEEISRLTRLKEPKNMIDRLKRIFS